MLGPVVPQAQLVSTKRGLVPKGDGMVRAQRARDAVVGAPGSRRPVRVRGCRLRGATDFRSSASTSRSSPRANRWRCTTGRPTRRTSSCSPARRCSSSRARSARFGDGTSCTALRGRTTRSSAPATPCLVLAVGATDRRAPNGCVHHGRCRDPPRRGRRARDDRPGRGLRPISPQRAHRIPRRLASPVAPRRAPAQFGHGPRSRVPTA